MEIAGEDAKYVYGHELLKIPSVKQAKIHAILISATTDDVDVEDCIVRYIIDHKAALDVLEVQIAEKDAHYGISG